ncbi:glycosyltransferase [Clostridiaceae bacterium M8S5]|nr:glycosyltransferase [Clostridiaceae bacterium M8S5]
MSIKNIKDITVATIVDEFSYNCFKYECNLKLIRRKTWKQDLEAIKDDIDLLFVESAWEGNGRTWQNSIINLHKRRNTVLRSVVNWCRARKIPTVFWNKEDPAHFHKFLGAAKYFNYVFTSDSNCISMYKEHLKHNKIYPLPFAAQPKIHNPINRDCKKKGKIAFAGSWYARQHQERKLALHNLLVPAMRYKIDIYDRNSHWNNINFKFPQMYKGFLKPRQPYKEIVKLYKKYNIFLNVNTVVDSPTMFSRRIYEFLACGTCAVSNKSIGMQKVFKDIVKIAESKDEAARYYKILLSNKETRDRIALRGIRQVFDKHTYKHRIKYILDTIKIKYTDEERSGVSIITCTNKDKQLDYILRNYNRQMYNNKELIIILNKNSLNIDECFKKAQMYKNVRIFKLDESKTLGACLNYAISKVKYNYVSKFDDDNFYGAHFIGDLMNAFTYTSADIVGKMSYYTYMTKSKTFAIRFPDNEHKYTDFLSGSAMIVKKQVFDKIKFIDKSTGEDTVFLKDCIRHGFKLYSADKYNYIVYRNGDVSKHTWKISDSAYLKNCKKLKRVISPQKYVSV